MTLHDITIQLKSKPWARERIARHDFIMDMLGDKTVFFNRDDLKLFIDEYNTIVRYIQMAQKEDESLRGEDYSHGKALSSNVALSLGYETGYNEFNKKVKTL